MDIAFLSKSLRDICESENALIERFGAQVANGVKDRLSDLRAATSINDVVLGNPRHLTGKQANCVCIDLPEDFNLMLCSNHVKATSGKTDNINWSSVTRVKILSIGKDNV